MSKFRHFIMFIYGILAHDSCVGMIIWRLQNCRWQDLSLTDGCLSNNQNVQFWICFSSHLKRKRTCIFSAFTPGRKKEKSIRVLRTSELKPQCIIIHGWFLTTQVSFLTTQVSFRVISYFVWNRRLWHSFAFL